MIKSGAGESQEEKEELPIAVEEQKARESLRKAIIASAKKIAEQENLFRVAKKVTKKPEEEVPAEDEKSKFKDLTKNFGKQSKKLIKKVWKSDELDETDLFLKNYILDKKWLSSKYKNKEDAQQQIIDEED